MRSSAVETSLKHIVKELGDIQTNREMLIKESREVISSSAHSIVSSQAGSLIEASSSLGKARIRLQELRKAASPQLQHYLTPAEAEYVEASVVYAVASGRAVPSCRGLGVQGGAYVLGLLDAIGEMKRMIYDLIRKGMSKEALHLFEYAERLYLLLSPLSVYDHVVPGVKRKLDVARILIEGTREAVTEEARREAVINAMRRVESAFGAKTRR